MSIKDVLEAKVARLSEANLRGQANSLPNDTFEDLLPLTPIRTAPGEYDVRDINGRTCWRMEGASFADFVCQSVNGYSAALKAIPLAHPDDALLDACRQFVHWYAEDSTEQKRDDAYESAVAAIKRAETEIARCRK